MIKLSLIILNNFNISKMIDFLKKATQHLLDKNSIKNFWKKHLVLLPNNKGTKTI